MASQRRVLLLAVAAAALLWIYSSSSLRGSLKPVTTPAASAFELGGQLGAVFDLADSDHDGKLNRAEFLSISRAASHSLVPPQAVAAAVPAARPAPQAMSAAVAAQAAAAKAIAGLPAASGALPQCSIVFFYHIVKTAGTTMRTVLQRQAQLGDFEYVYSDTTRKPRWQLIMHQLSHRVTARRIIIELHSEWGLARGFFADVRRLRRLYEPLGCKV